MENLIDSFLVPVVTGFAGAFSGWFFGRRKQAAEAVRSELESVEKAVAIWRQIAQDLKAELALQTVQINSLKAEVEALRQDNTRLMTELRAIKKAQNK